MGSKKIIETKLSSYLKAGRLEAGCDEAGRGCLAGPVFASAVILPDDFSHPLLADSKKISHKTRILLRQVIEEAAISWSVASVDHKKIDEINILNASILAMHLAIKKLSVKPDFLLIDGHRFHAYPDIPHSCEIKGDGRFASIAAASVLAKTYRDDYMKKIHQEYPGYGWDRNKGYPSSEHRRSINKLGISTYHRLSFKLLNDQLSIDF